jgi:peptide/nickel transport system substrate-binding protein
MEDKVNKPPSLLSCLIVAAIILAACAPATTTTPEAATTVPKPEGTSSPTGLEGQPTAVPQEPVVLRIGSLTEPDNLNYALQITGWFWNDLIYEGYIHWGERCVRIPRLADSLEQSEDGLSWTIHLRPGITYSDGTPLTAQTVKEYWDWYTSTFLKDYWAASRNTVSTEVIDELTFRFTTSVPISNFATADADWMWPLPPHIWGSLDDEGIVDFDNSNPIGPGPYVLTEWERGSHLIMDARPEYHLGRPPIDRVIFQIYGNWDAVVSALLSGEIDMTDSGLPPEYYDAVAGQPNITVAEEPPGWFYELVFNVKEGGTKHPAIDDPKVREAIDYAVDKQQIVDVALLGHGETCPTNWNCGSLWQESYDPSIELTPFDISKANNILDEAGYLDTDGDEVREMPGGQPLDFRIFFRSDRPSDTAIAEMLEGWLAEIGVSVSPEAMEMGTLLNAMDREHDFDLAIHYWLADSDPATVDYALSCWSAEGQANNDSGYCKPEFDELVYRWQTSVDPEEMTSYLYEFEQMINRDRPYIFLAGVNGMQAYRSDRFKFMENACPYYGMLFDWWPLINAEVIE